MNEFKIEPWDDGDKIIVGPGGPIGCSLSPKDAGVVCSWINTAYKEITSNERERCAKIAETADGEDPYCCVPLAKEIAKKIREAK